MVERLPINPVAKRAKIQPRVVGPVNPLVTGFYYKGIVAINVIGHRRMIRGNCWNPSGHVLHQGQALAFAVGAIHHVTSGRDQIIISFLLQKSME